MRYCDGSRHFLDTNVVLRLANNSAVASEAADIARILDDAAAATPTRKLWISSALLGELRPSIFIPSARFPTVDDLAAYIRSIADVVGDANIMLRVARLRDILWQRHPDIRQASEKPCRLTFGDALHLASALWVKEALTVGDLEFLTLDDGRSKNEEDFQTNPLPLLSLEDYTHGLGANPDVIAVCQLHRCRPKLRQGNLGT